MAQELARERGRRELAETSASEMRQALHFKDVAIQEVHHRVKNTLQIVASLLSLQARQTKLEEVRTALREGHGRLRLLTKVHELLYSNASSAQEILMPALLQAIGDALERSFDDTSKRVRLRIACDLIALSADDAIPLALLANEAITNAYKYAYPQPSSGEITVSLRCSAANAIVLRIADHGIGLRAEVGHSGLGAKLIRTFAAQLQGALAFDQPSDSTGTIVTLTIRR